MTVHFVKMLTGFGDKGITTKGRTLEIMARLKRSIEKVMAKENCLAYAQSISIARLTNDPSYKAYIQGDKIRHVVDHVLAMTGLNLANGEDIL
jgi:hypothetical protein